MRRESLKYLYDVMQATGIIAKVCSTQTYQSFADDVVIRSAVERQFEIAGEALSQLGKIDPHTFERVPHAPQIVAFRNFLIHRYPTSTACWSGASCRTIWGNCKR